MSIEYRVLGQPGGDNAVYARVLTGQAIHRLLFDCGEGCLNELDLAQAQAVDHLCFSHLHMDHIGGFDHYLRLTYNRSTPPNEVWGPPRTAEIIHHRLRGFMWNLYEGEPGIWYVNDLYPDHAERWRFLEREAFALAHAEGERRLEVVEGQESPALVTPDYSLTALHMDHHVPSLAYILREAPRVNVDLARLAALGLAPGPWLRLVKEARPGETASVLVGEQRHDLAALRQALLVATPGASLAYLTDFLLDDAALARLVPALRGCDTLICESQYRTADTERAWRHHHMTAAQAAMLAQRAEVGQLVLFHLSLRYQPPEWLALLDEARAIFPNTRFPAHWSIGAA